jgi:ABC-type amino acid transport substrate-binding protein
LRVPFRRAQLCFTGGGGALKKSIRLAALLLVLCLMLPLAGCGKVVGRYRVLETLATQEFSIGYRENDYVRYYVDAALQTLAADGTVGTLAYKWFGEDKTSFSKNINALEQAGQAAPRTLLIGVDADAFPMSYLDGETYSGFDVELAREVCSRLGWEAKFISIKAENAYVELSSGNIDVAWGGLALAREDVNYEVTSPYLTNDIVIVTLAQGGPKSLRGLKDGTLAMTVEQKYMDALASNEKLMERLGQIKRVSGGTQSLFDQLNSGAVNAIIVYSLALNYTG